MEVVLWLIGLSLASAEFAQDYAHIEAFLEQKKFPVKRKYRPMYHIVAPVGWVGYPAGFVFYKSMYHVFYQYHPYNGAWAATHWGHVASKNLIDWKHYPPALVPKDYYEKHGCLAGSALIHNRYLTLFYSGHVVSNNATTQTQNVAISADAIMFRKYLYNPVIRTPPFGVGDFRNPKVWRYSQHWYMMVGSATPDYHGKIELYTSADMFSWKFNKTLAYSYGDMGYMWESPDVIDIDGLDVLILSVQGIEPDGFRFRNNFQTGYLVGKFNYKSLEFDDMEISTTTFHELDHGHDFYAAKTMVAPDGRRLVIGWIGAMNVEVREAKNGWAHMLTLVRELQLDRYGAIRMYPVRETTKLRSEILESAWYSPGESFRAGYKSFEIQLNATTALRDINLSFEWGVGNQFKIGYSADHRYISIDRGGNDGVRRADWCPLESVNLRIFIDSSSVEVYCGFGEVVFTSRIYPYGLINVRVGGETNVHITQYKLRRSVGHDKFLLKELKNHYVNKYKGKKG